MFHSLTPHHSRKRDNQYPNIKPNRLPQYILLLQSHFLLNRNIIPPIYLRSAPITEHLTYKPYQAPQQKHKYAHLDLELHYEFFQDPLIQSLLQ